MNPFDFINDISLHKKNLIDDSLTEKEYNQYIVNKGFSLYRDTIFYSNVANKLHHLDKKLQHDYLFYAVPKKKRWAKWPKRYNIENLEAVENYYKYSREKAKTVLSLLNDDQLAIIKKEQEQGGVKK